MDIYCAVCNRNMTGVEFLTYSTGVIVKALGKPIAYFVLDTLKDRFTAKRGMGDNGLAAGANAFSVPCPNCESVGRWNPFKKNKIEEST